MTSKCTGVAAWGCRGQARFRSPQSQGLRHDRPDTGLRCGAWELAGALMFVPRGDCDAMRQPLRITPNGCRGARHFTAVGPVHVVTGQVLVAAEDLALLGWGFCRGWGGCLRRSGVRRWPLVCGGPGAGVPATG